MTQLQKLKIKNKAKPIDLNIFKVKMHFNKAMPLDQFWASFQSLCGLI